MSDSQSAHVYVMVQQRNLQAVLLAVLGPTKCHVYCDSVSYEYVYRNQACVRRSHTMKYVLLDTYLLPQT